MVKINKQYFKIESNMKANKVEDILDKDESVLLRTKPNKKAYIFASFIKMFPFAFIWAIFDGFALGMVCKYVKEIPPSVIWYIVLFFLFHLIPVWIWLGGIIKAALEFKNIEYVFTEKRIILRNGIIGIDFQNIYYSEIEDISLEVGILDRILKVGDIYIDSKKQSACLYDIANPYIILSKLQKITLDIKTDIHFPNDLRPGTNHGYKTKQKERQKLKNNKKGTDVCQCLLLFCKKFV